MHDDESPKEGHLDINGQFVDAADPKRPQRLQPWQRPRLSEQHRIAAAPETPVSTDIGNFFRLLLTLIKGVWNGDMTDYELLSSVYFPQPPQEKTKQDSAPQEQESPAADEATNPPENTGTQENEPHGTGEYPHTTESPVTSPQAKSGTQRKEEHKLQAQSSERSQATPPASGEPKKDPIREVIEKNVREMNKLAKDPNHPDRKLSTAEIVAKYTKGIPRPPGFDHMIGIILPFEGISGEVNEHEPNAGISKWGINSKAHPELGTKGLTKAQISKLTPEEIDKRAEQKVRALTKEEASAIIRDDYDKKLQWPGDGRKNMGFAVKTIALDSAVNGGLSFGNKILRESYEKAHHDVAKMPEIMIQMRREHYADLISKNPKKYGDNKNGWEDRIRKLEEITASYLPFERDKYTISDTYKVRKDHPVHGRNHHHDTGSFHRGTDWAVPEGTPLFANGSGKVMSAKEHTGYGQTLIIYRGNGIYEMYAHLKMPLVHEGAEIKKGQKIALSGNTGVSTGAHLHHEIWLQKGNEIYAIDERKTVGRNLLDPTVRDELIRDAKKVSDIRFSPYPTVTGAIPEEYKQAGAEITRRIHEEPMVASKTTASTPDPVLR